MAVNYVIYPGINDQYQFPAEVRAALASAPEFTSEFVEDEGTPTDGQIMVYSATLGKWVPGNPGTSELAYAENVTNVQTQFGSTGGLGAAVDIPGLSIIVPVSARPVYVSFRAKVVQTAAGDGSLYMNCVDEGGVTVGGTVRRVPNTLDITEDYFDVYHRFRLGPTAAQKTLKIQGQIYTDGGVTVTANALNDPNYGNRSFIAAEAV